MNTTNTEFNQDTASAMADVPKSVTGLTCERPPVNETRKQRIARLIRDSDKGATSCVSCAGSQRATVDALDNVIEWIIVTFRRIRKK